MHTLSVLAAVAILAIAPAVSHAQTHSGNDQKGHHPAQAQPAPAGPGMGMGMKGSGGGMMGSGDMSQMMAMMHGDMMGRGMMGRGMMGAMPMRHVEGRLAFLKTELKITPAQEPQWTKFADTVRSTAKTAQAGMQSMMQAGPQAATAPDLLGRYEKTLTLRLEAVRAVKSAFDPLYSSLSDEQKKVADELLTGPMGVL